MWEDGSSDRWMRESTTTVRSELFLANIENKAVIYALFHLIPFREQQRDIAANIEMRKFG